MANFAAGPIGADVDLIDIGALSSSTPLGETPTSFSLALGPELDQFTGGGFTFGANGFPVVGTITDIQETLGGQASFAIHGLSLPVANLLSWIATDANQAAKSTLFAGSDQIAGSAADDLLRGYAGDDTIDGGAGGANYLRGDDGADSISGGAGFDDINGNMGADTLHGNAGDDWVVGGKDNDVQFGDAGGDIVWGNLGNDTLDGGDGADEVRGGQGDDVLTGGAGDDYVSGDRGNDTESGGAGADLFHGSQDAGIDRVLDFHIAEGDRVMLDPGTVFTVRQDGADTVIDLGQGNEMILVGVQMSSLTSSSIFLG
jgi:serralysin